MEVLTSHFSEVQILRRIFHIVFNKVTTRALHVVQKRSYLHRGILSGSLGLRG